MHTGVRAEVGVMFSLQHIMCCGIGDWLSTFVILYACANLAANVFVLEESRFFKKRRPNIGLVLFIKHSRTLTHPANPQPSHRYRYLASHP